MRNLGLTENQLTEMAVEADKSGLSGKFVGTIEYAIIQKSDTGTEYVRLGIKHPNGTVYEPSKPYFIEDKNGKDMKDKAIIANIIALTGKDQSIDRRKATLKEYSPAENKQIEVTAEHDQLIGLVGKKIGVVIMVKQVYPNSLGINGYTGRPITTKQENPSLYEQEKNNPETIWMKDYSKETKPVFSFTMFYDPSKGASFNELLSGVTTENLKDVKKAVDKAVDSSNNVPAITDDSVELDKIRKGMLEYKLKKANLSFDEKRFIYSAKSGKVTTSAPPMDDSDFSDLD